MKAFLLILILTPGIAFSQSANTFCHFSSPYFVFNTNANPSDKDLSALAGKKPGALVALNPLTEDDEFKTAEGYFKIILPAFSTVVGRLKKHGLKPAAYLEGPHGQTGGVWKGGEKQRMEALAKHYATKSGSVCPKAIVCWLKTGWLDYMKDQLKGLSAMGVEAFEIDNLGNDAGYAQAAKTNGQGAMPGGLKADIGAPDYVVGFFASLSQWMREQNPPIKMKIILKNVTPWELKAIHAAMTASPPVLNRANFADFHIAEKAEHEEHHQSRFNSTYRRLQAEASSQIGIQLVGSNNTDDYRGEGGFDPSCSGRVAEALPGASLPRDNARPQRNDALSTSAPDVAR